MKAVLCVLLLFLARVGAHEEPTSYVNLIPEHDALTVEVVASATDFAHYLPGVDSRMLLQSQTLQEQQPALTGLVQARPRFGGQERKSVSAGVITEKEDVRLVFRAGWPAAPATVRVECALFPYDPRHRTFVTVRHDGVVESTKIFDAGSTSGELSLGKPLRIPAVMQQFFREGLHHIFIGPDHILFVVGLLLLGGGVRRLLAIVTAFTVAHSITLCLATLRIFTPPASIIEPVIALSIVLVGIHAILPVKRRDPRLVFAFLFGLVHGFGFAFALGEIHLSGTALGWSLFAFNGGVEAGQAVIILATAPLLALVRRYSEKASERLVTACAACVVMAGSYWFVERLLA